MFTKRSTLETQTRVSLFNFFCTILLISRSSARRSNDSVPYLRLDRLRGARDVGVRGASSLDPPDVLVKRPVYIHVGETEQYGHAQALFYDTRENMINNRVECYLL